jgi:ATP/maltotriose-dependent transcriptional regulator MalT
MVQYGYRDEFASQERADRREPVSLLMTKLYIPPLRSGTVARPRLIEWLNAGLNGKLTLISASAGFGKTTLLRIYPNIACSSRT